MPELGAKPTLKRVVEHRHLLDGVQRAELGAVENYAAAAGLDQPQHQPRRPLPHSMHRAWHFTCKARRGGADMGGVGHWNGFDQPLCIGMARVAKDLAKRSGRLAGTNKKACAKDKGCVMSTTPPHVVLLPPPTTWL